MEILEVLKYTLPSFIVFLTAYFIIRKFIDNEIKKRAFDLSSMNNELITPVRLQAYERLALFLERISPEFLIMRTNQPGMNAKQLHSELLAVIRTEFEHNLSQQIYVSQKTWEVIKNCRGNLLKIINLSAAVVNPDSPSINLSKTILEKIMDMDQSPTDEALAYLKKEIQTNFF